MTGENSVTLFSEKCNISVTRVTTPNGHLTLYRQFFPCDEKRLRKAIKLMEEENIKEIQGFLRQEIQDEEVMCKVWANRYVRLRTEIAEGNSVTLKETRKDAKEADREFKRHHRLLEGYQKNLKTVECYGNVTECYTF